MQFRDMRRSGQALSAAACVEVLQSEKRGVLAVAGDNGYPYAVPMNFYYDAAAHKIYLHCAKDGHKLDALRKNPKICFTVWTPGEKTADDWAYYVKSVVIFGEADICTDMTEIREKVEALGRKYYPNAQEVAETMREHLDKMHLLSVHITHMTGKLVHEK